VLTKLKESLNRFKELLLTKEVFVQLIGGLVAGIIGFMSALLYGYIQDKYEVKDQRNTAIIKLHREISENRFLLEEQLRKDTVMKARMNTIIWETQKYYVDFKRKYLMEGITAVYDEIKSYNETCDFIEHSVTVRGMRVDDPQMTKAKDSLNEILKELIEHHKALEQLMFQELVYQKLAKPKDWERGKWDDDIMVPRIKPDLQKGTAQRKK
jgi:hypothetical protein